MCQISSLAQFHQESGPVHFAYTITRYAYLYYCLDHGGVRSPQNYIQHLYSLLYRCDSISLDGKGPSTGPQSSYTHAQKMRASMTYLFGRVCKLGNVYWQQSGSTVSGNPSVSNEVASYMVSLRRRKVQAGETPTSARAINLVCYCIQLYSYD